jgi:hypothetical protein
MSPFERNCQKQLLKTMKFTKNLIVAQNCLFKDGHLYLNTSSMINNHEKKQVLKTSQENWHIT